MKIVNKYLCKNFLGPFCLTFFVALFVLLMQFVWKWVDELVGKGLEVSVMLKLLFYAAVSLSSMAFPLAVMLGFAGEQIVAILVMLGSATTVSCYIMAKSMGHEGTLSSSIVMVTTFGCSFTLTFWLFILKTLLCLKS